MKVTALLDQKEKLGKIKIKLPSFISDFLHFTGSYEDLRLKIYLFGSSFRKQINKFWHQNELSATNHSGVWASKFI